MSLPWFRLWADAVDDDKLRLLDFGDRWQFVAMLCLKAQGVLDDEDEERRARKIAVKLGLTLNECETVMKRLVTAGLLSESWNPTNWKKRQFKSDSSTSRVKAFRKRFRNVSETDQKQIQKQIQKKEEPPIPPSGVTGLDEPSWNRFVEYRQQIRRPLKPASIPAAQRHLAAFGPIQAAVVDQTVANGWQGLFELKRQSAAKPPEPVRTWRPVDDETQEAVNA